MLTIKQMNETNKDLMDLFVIYVGLRVRNRDTRVSFCERLISDLDYRAEQMFRKTLRS